MHHLLRYLPKLRLIKLVLANSLVITGLLLGTSQLSAQGQDMNLTAEQMAQLQALSPQQRQALLDSLGGQSQSGSQAASASNTPVDSVVQVTPRPTQSDSPSQIEQATATAPVDMDLQAASRAPVRTQALEQFGYSLFAGSPSTFAPATDIPVPANYIMGPGDTVILQLYGQQNTTHELVITREGMLLFPQIGPVAVAGLNFDELRAQINDIVSNQLIGQRAAVTLGSLRSIRIFILGEAFRPGSYTVSALSTMTNALFVSGGITNVGSLRNVQLRRQGVTVSELDLYDLLLRGDTSADVRLQPDDVLFIPPVGTTVGISGEVIRPAIYELKEESTAEEVVALAGGMLPTAFPRDAKIERIDIDGDRTVIDVDLTADAGQETAMRDGDRMQVGSVLDRLQNVVLTEGHLQRPGGFQWREGMRVADVIPSVSVLLPNPDLEYALLVRESQPSRLSEVHRLALGEAINNPDSAANLILEPNDRIITFGATVPRESNLVELISELQAQASFNNPPAIVRVQGNVRFPGQYPFVQDMSVEDVLNAAGGLSENTDSDFSLIVSRKDNTGAIEAQTAMSETGELDRERQIAPDDTLFVFGANSPRQDLLSDTVSQLQSQAGFNNPPALVQVRGNVRFPGQFPFFDNMTISDLLNASGGLSENTDNDFALIVSRRDNSGAITTSSAMSDMRELDRDRLLDPADTLLVFNANSPRDDLLSETVSQLKSQARSVERSQVVRVSGQVRFPGEYPLFSGMDVGDLLEAAGGFTESALISDAEISRFYVMDGDGRRVDHFEVDLNSDGAMGRNMRLAEFDNLVIRQIPNWTEPETITLSGELVSPGTYTIAKGDTLSSVLRRAGGLTAFADSNASVLLRDSLREQEREQLARYRSELESDIAAVALEQDEQGQQTEVIETGENLLAQVEEAEPLGRLIIDLPQVLAGNMRRDVIMRAGDQLIIPRVRQEVSIMGEVQYPTSHLYNEELSVGDYINLSGGLTQRADASRAYIIKANGQVVSYGDSRWFFQRNNTFEAGDTIVVPFDIEPTNYLQTWTSISQVMFNLATSILAINSVQN